MATWQDVITAAQTLLQRWKRDVDFTSQIVNGPASGPTSVVNTDGGTIPTFAKTLGDAAAESQSLRSDLDSTTDSAKGAALVGYDGGTVQDVLDSAKPLASYTALRSYTGRATSIRITQTGIAGYFWRDDSDTTSSDDGGTLIVASNGKRWKRIIDTVAIKGAWFGISAASADNRAAMDAAAAAAISLGINKLELPPGTLVIKKGFVHPHYLHVFGAGKDKTIVSCQPVSADFATATGWHFGTYGPGNSSQGTPKFETGYTFNAAAVGNDSVTLTTAAEAGNFAVGDLVSVEGSTLNASTLNTPNEMAIIISADAGTGIVKFDAGLKSDYPTGAATLKIRKLNTGIPSTVSMVAANPGLTAYALRGARLSDMTVEATTAGYSAVDFSCFDCDLERVKAIGYNAFAGNPCARTRFVDCEGMFTNAPFEPAYLTHDSFWLRGRFVRTAVAPNPASCAGLWINSGEGAKYFTFQDVEVIDDDPNATSAHGAVEINAEGSKFIRGSVYCTRQTDSIQCGSGVLIDGVTILKSGSNGILATGTGGTIINNRIFNTLTGKNAIQLGASAVRNLIANNDLGRGTKVLADSINDVATAKNNEKRNNRTFYTKDRSYTTFPNTLTGTLTETTRATLSYAAGTVDVGHYFDVNLSGVCAGASATKTVKLKADAVTAVTLTLPATGAFDLRGRIGCSQGSQTWFYDMIATVNGVATPFIGTFNNNLAASTSVSITEQLGNTGDSITTYMCEIRAVNESATLS